MSAAEARQTGLDLAPRYPTCPGCGAELAPYGDAWACWNDAGHGLTPLRDGRGLGVIWLPFDLGDGDQRREARDRALGRAQ